MTNASSADNSHELPSCYLNLNESDCVYMRYDEGILIMLYYWENNECTQKEDYCVMIFNCN